jgi:hypothetical protein
MSGGGKREPRGGDAEQGGDQVGVHAAWSRWARSSLPPIWTMPAPAEEPRASPFRRTPAARDTKGAVLGKQAAASSLGQAMGSVVAGSGFAWLGRELFWATARVLLIGAVLSAGMPLFSAQRATRSGARF